MADINSLLRDMRKAGKVRDNKAKGNIGEDAVLHVVLELQNKIGGVVYHSLSYPYQKDAYGRTYTGNIMLENGGYKEYTESKRGFMDEIDVLYVTSYRIFPIEVKSYHAKLEVFDHWVKKNGQLVDKSPLLQEEKHCRHLYHALYAVLPDGLPTYIIPLVCFVDRCTVEDTRSRSFQDYMPVCILNNLKRTIVELNTPLQYNLDVEQIQSKINTIKTSCENIYK